jgi:hypothetical protein
MHDIELVKRDIELVKKEITAVRRDIRILGVIITIGIAMLGLLIKL